MAIKKIMLLDAERRAILAECDKRGIRYMPLKGVIMKELYPYIGLRQMSDNDILVDEQNRAELRDIMVFRGYYVYMYNDGNHDVYTKQPVYNYEIHVSLFGDDFNTEFKEYFSTAFDEGIKAPDSCSYSMTDDYYYVYFKAHEYKHWRGGGTGLRSLVDTYVFLKSKQNSINEGKIKAELTKLGIYDYEQRVRALSLKLFDPTFAEENLTTEMLTDDEAYFLDDFLIHGTYGSARKMTENSIEKIREQSGKRGLGGAKIKYILGRLFPPAEAYKTSYPLAYKYRILIPFVVIKRILAMIFVRPKTSMRTLRNVFRYKKK